MGGSHPDSETYCELQSSKEAGAGTGSTADKGDRAESSEMKAYAYGPSGSVKGGEPIQWAATISLANGAGTADVHVQESEVAPLPDTACKQALEVGYRTAVRNERTKPFEENKHLPP